MTRSWIGRCSDRLGDWFNEAEERHGEVPMFIFGILTLTAAVFGLIIGVVAVVVFLMGPSPPLECEPGTRLESYREYVGKTSRTVYRCARD